MVPELEWVVMILDSGWGSTNMMGSMSSEALLTVVSIYHVEGEVMIKMVEIMDSMVDFGEIMS